LLPRALGPLVPGAIVRGPTHGAGRPCLYVTVDDGPDPTGTPRWLDALARHGAAGLFFLSAPASEAHPDLVRRVAEAGHRIGSHGDAHVSGWRSPGTVRSSFGRAEAVLQALVGGPVRDVRPPYGRVTPGLVRWAREGDRRIVLWDVMPGDFLASRAPEVLADEVVRLARAGSILALHDGPPAARAVAALDLALPRLAAAGWTFPALPAP
jgi:peptidoglycan/xylan/chitin deacetylase (PgdA/CDA1 family)